MKPPLALLIPFFLFSSAAAARVEYRPGEVIVQFKPGVSVAAQTKTGTRKAGELGSPGLVHLKLTTDETVEGAVARLSASPDVEYAQPNFIYRAFATPNDPKYAREWGLKNSGQTITTVPGENPAELFGTNNPGTSGKDMGLETAWDRITDCSAAIVAVVDTGVNYNHSDLSANMWDGGGIYTNHGYDFASNDTDPMDEQGHGTHVAGTIAATGNNGVGTTGVCWTAKIMAVRVLDATGIGYTDTITAGVNFAVDQGARVINMSLGGASYDAAFGSAITNARSNDAVVVVAAGNEGSNNDNSPSYPCSFTQNNLICVAALTQTYALASFSNYGASSVDVGAPGTNIVSDWAGTVDSIDGGMTSGWSKSSTTGTGWGYKTLMFGSLPVQCLVDPSDYQYGVNQYANNTDDRIWKSFDTSGSDVAVLSFYVMWDLAGTDSVRFYASAAAGDPVPAGTELDSVTGSSAGYAYLTGYDISPFIALSTTVGFRLLSDASGTSYGSNVSFVSIDTLTWTPTAYALINGTSMASPHVAGLAAMVAAYNPSYTYQDIVAALKLGGLPQSSLAGTTSTGRAVHALGALAYISPPSGVTATKE